MARDDGKPLAWINMMGDPPNHRPDEATVRMALPGLIYHKWDPAQAEDEAAVEWVLEKLRALAAGEDEDEHKAESEAATTVPTRRYTGTTTTADYY